MCIFVIIRVVHAVLHATLIAQKIYSAFLFYFNTFVLKEMNAFIQQECS